MEERRRIYRTAVVSRADALAHGSLMAAMKATAPRAIETPVLGATVSYGAREIHWQEFERPEPSPVLRRLASSTRNASPRWKR